MIRRDTPLLAVVLTLALTGCAPVAEPSRSLDAGPAGSTDPGPLIVADVLTYKGGNARTGEMPGPGPAHAPVVLWEVPTNASFLAGPLVADGVVIAATEDGTVLGIDAESGREAWPSVSLPAGVVATPAIADGTLYVLTLDGVVRTVSLADRSLGWTAEGFNPESIITVVDDVVLVGAPGALVALSRTDGSEVWRVAAPGSDRAATDGTLVYTGGDGSGVVTAFRLEDRTISWVPDTSAARVLTPSIVGDTVHVATRDVPGRQNAVLRIAADGSITWRTEPKDGESIGGHAILDGRVFASLELPTPAVIALDATSGKRLWQEAQGRDLTFPVVTRDHVYVTSSEDGVVALDPASGAVAWQAPIGDAIEAEMAVTGGLVVVTTSDRSGGGRVVALADPDDPRVAALASAAPATPPPTEAPSVYEVLDVTPVEGQSLLLGLAVGPDGTMYAADMWNWRILVRHPDGTLESWGERGSGRGEFDFSEVSQNDSSTSVSISPDGELIAVGDGGNYRVQLFDRDRTWLRSIGRLGREDGQFINPCCVTVDADHNVWVVDPARNVVQVFEEDGDHIRTFGEPGSGDGQLRRPGSAFVDLEANEVLIPDFGNRRVTVFSTKGTWLRHIGLPADAGIILDEVNAVARDRFGQTYILDTSTRIFVLDASGALVGTIPSIHPELGFVEPSPFVVDEDGRLYLADIGGTTAGRLLILQLLPPLWPE